ncbi:hypothetical protein AWC38_SpisGene22299 [Stylophora pistillata]|uniref:Uncharacterized protein n=1 Tax=Stylophora pistillata TaxID=50429 RepID=A0A2B4R7I0_STYPI|nr:hypothetical protein AWC38_SpisGene22299 [Stylophora pistillata]
MEQVGEYGYFKNEKFTTVSNFILRCEGVVEEDGDVVGFMLRAKPKKQQKLGGRWMDMCNEYERMRDGCKTVPVKVFGLQPKSDPPVWVFSKDMQLQLNGDNIIRLKETDSHYAVNGDCCSTLFTRILPIPYGKRSVGNKGIKERLEGRSRLENLHKDLPRSISVVLKLHNDYQRMTKDVLFNAVQDVVEEMKVDVRSEASFSVLFTTGKVLGTTPRDGLLKSQVLMNFIQVNDSNQIKLPVCCLKFNVR